MNRKEENRLLELGIGYASFPGRDAEEACSGPADGEISLELCGDTAVSCWLPDGSRAVILSDGMGRGSAAAAESRLAASMLCRRLKQGMSVDRAIKEVNRYLLHRSCSRECFATVDLMILDRAAGRARFYKLGAAPSYLIRGRRIRKVQQPALPVGIVPRLKLTHVSARLAAGDIILMMSDGICDSGGIQEEDWITSFLNDLIESGTIRTLGPRQLAAKVLQEARRRYGSGESDDATVAAVMIK